MFCFKENRKGIAILNLETNTEVWFKKQNIFPLMGLKTTIGFEHNGTTSIFSNIKK